MTTSKATPSHKVWETIERERRRDHLIRGVSVVAWSVTVIIVLLFSWFTAEEVGLIVAGHFRWGLFSMTLLGSAQPFLLAMGVLSVLIATLATIGVFLRMRTASLLEIQLRLAALEEMLAPGSEV